MNSERWGETILGAIVTVVAIGFLTFAVANSGQTRAGGGYDLTASFPSVDGIAIGSDVRVSGVKVGVVRDITLDPSTYLARVTFNMNRDVQVLDDSLARIKTDGILGGGYVSIEPAGLEPLQAGGEIPNTQSSVDLFTALASLANSASSNSSQSDESPTQ
jgi:phospholipid/cholesterol/gamma-HCH transport system substrate-binding protein